MTVALFYSGLIIAEGDPDVCAHERLSTTALPHMLYVCVEGIDKQVSQAVRFWNSKKDSFIISYDHAACSRDLHWGEVRLTFDNAQVAKMDTDTTTTYGLTNRAELAEGLIIYSFIYLSTETDKEDLTILLTHELGHALGYGHVDRACVDHVMNPFISNMGHKF